MKLTLDQARKTLDKGSRDRKSTKKKELIAALAAMESRLLYLKEQVEKIGSTSALYGLKVETANGLVRFDEDALKEQESKLASTLPEYAELLKQSGALKSRARSMLSEGTASEEWQAILLLRRAVGLEYDAREKLPQVTNRTLILSTIEICETYVLAEDPVSAIDAWLDLQHEPELASVLESDLGKASTARLQKNFWPHVEAFCRVWKALGFLDRDSLSIGDKIDESWVNSAYSILMRNKGVAELWWFVGKYATNDKIKEDARKKAVELDANMVEDGYAVASWNRMVTKLQQMSSVGLPTD